MEGEANTNNGPSDIREHVLKGIHKFHHSVNDHGLSVHMTEYKEIYKGDSKVDNVMELSQHFKIYS